MINRGKKMIAILLAISLCTVSMPVDVTAADMSSVVFESGETGSTEQDSQNETPDLFFGDGSEQTTTSPEGDFEEIEDSADSDAGSAVEEPDDPIEDLEIEDLEIEDPETENPEDFTEEFLTAEEESPEETEDADSSLFLEGDSIDAVTINTIDELLALCEKGAQYYQNAAITIAPTGGALDLTDTAFTGFGSEQFPFRGSIVFSGSVGEYVTLKCALFQYLSQDATVGSEQTPLNLMAADNMTSALLAENYTAGTPDSDGNTSGKTITIRISTEAAANDESGTDYSTFGGIIGTMAAGTELRLNVIDNIASGHASVTGSGNRGFFCNTMGEGARLTIASYTGNMDFDVTSSDSAAGALVGSMGKNAELTVLQDFSYPGNVTGKTNAGGLAGYAADGVKIILNGSYSVLGNTSGAAITSASGNAGGLLGYGENTSVTVAEGKTVVIDTTVRGKAASGGLAGSYTFHADTDRTYDLSKFTVAASFKTGDYAGGAFGKLYNKSSAQVLTITSGSSISSTCEGAANFGGLIGYYSASNLTAALVIEKSQVSSVLTNNTSYGGLIANVDGNSSSYIEVNDVEVNMNSEVRGANFGGLVAVSDGSSMFNVGTVKVSGSLTTGYTVYGGIVGALNDGVLRLHGTTDISGITLSNDVSNNIGQIVGTRNSALIYAMGSGSDEGWKLIRDGSGKSISDVGSWGEVVRIDGTKLKEVQVTADISKDTEHLLQFNTAAHTVTISGFSSYDDKRGYFYSTQAFAAFALSYQCTVNTAVLKREVTDVGGGWWIFLETDIDLTGTGITGISRDNGTSAQFTGKLDGQNHKITLAVGETYGLLSGKTPVDNKDGCGQIYCHKYLGLFARTGEMNDKNGIMNLTIVGSITFGNTEWSGRDIFCGIVSASQEGSATYQNVTSSVAVSYKNGTKTGSMPDVYVGGLTACVAGGRMLTLKKCTWNGTIQDDCTAYNYYLGGFVGYIGDDVAGGGITASDCRIAGSISALRDSNDARLGGFLAATQNTGSNKVKITVTNLTIDNLSIQNGAKNTSGGLLGYEWHNVDFDVNGLEIKDSSLNASNGAGFGGLVYRASGYWKVHDSGIRFTGSNSFTGKSVNETPSALLVCRGDDYSDKDYALYMEIGAGAYQVADTTSVILKGGNYFDEIVGVSINGNGNGIVSIASDSAHSRIDQSGCNTYQKQLTNSYDNPNTRYYYNLDALRLDSSNQVWADNQAGSGEELLLWSVGQYCESNLSAYFTTSRGGSLTIQGAIDLTGLSYYPVDYVGAVDIQDAQITFDHQKIEETESSAPNKNKMLSDKKRQHYMMQDGLFLSLMSSASAESSLSISGDLTLSGTIGQLNSSDYDGGSGALICGKANGQINGTVVRTFSFSVDSSASLVLNNLRVYSAAGLDDYAPLLINEVGSYSSLNVVNVSTSGYTSGTIAATSLIGYVGSETGTNIVLLFENIALDGRTQSSIFSNATLLESFSYDKNDLSSSGTYNFSKGSTFTYGKEISNGVNGHGGRNPYNAVEVTGQVWYCDTVGFDGQYVTDGTVTAIDGDGFFIDAYLRYVHVPEGGTDGTVSWKHEIDVNQLVVDIESGCGTYDDPYIINKNGQLETLAKFLSTGSIAGWKINICYDAAASTGSVSLATDGTSHYRYTSGSTWKTTNASGSSLTSAKVRAYLRNAYYMVTDDITLNSSFYGLGGSDQTSSVFSGVIIGKKSDGSAPVITVSSHASTTHNYFGGLIAYSGGSVVKNLVLDYSGTSLTLKANKPSQKRAEQSFFGGVIGYVVGGDNIIDNVEVRGLDTFSLTLNGTDDKVNGTYANLTPAGAYVGLIGGNVESGGGVIFRNMTYTGFSGEDYAENSAYYYRNAYVGRVLDGYACAEDCTVYNTDKNYKIPTISTSTDKIAVTAPSDNKAVITINHAQQLWVLSAIVNSGAGGMDQNGSYNTDAYKLGCVRTGSYENVGSTAAGNDAVDCKYWGGVTYQNQEKISYLVSAYADTNAAYVSGGSYSYGLNFTADCDMTSYGNGFRGIGSSYQDNQSSDILKRTIYLGGSVGNSQGEWHTVTINRNVKEYSTEQVTADASGWWTQGIGLFPVVNFNTATTVQYLTLSGTAGITYPDDTDCIGETATGGFAGLTANRGSDSNVQVTFSDVKISSLTITGSKYSGGLVGLYGKNNRTLKTGLSMFGTRLGAVTIQRCDYDKITIRGGYSAGGYFGSYQNDGQTTTLIGPCSYTDSSIQWTQDACLDIYKKSSNANASKTNGYSGGGGLIGYYSAGEFKINSDKDDTCALNFSGVQISAPQFSYNCDYGIGSLTGLQAAGKLTACYVNADNVTVQILLDENFSNASFKKDTKYYLTVGAGIYVGYGKAEINFKNCKIDQSYVLNAGYAGGYVGTTNSTLKVENSVLKNTVIYTKGAASYDGASKAGGISGNVTGSLTVTNVFMENNVVIADGRTGLIIGFTRNESTLSITGFSAKGCKIATSQNPTAEYFIRGNTDPGNRSNTSKDTDNSAGSAGIIIGSVTENGNSLKFTTLNSLKVFNMRITDCIVGYYMGGSTLKEVQKADETTIGVYTAENTGISYSNLTGDKAMSSDQKYTGGNLGKLIGGAGSISTMQVSGLSIQGQYYPYYENGYGSDNQGINGSSSSYVIYADYTGVSSSDQPNTTGTVNKDYTSGYSTSIASPYVVVNPSSGFTVYANAENDDKRALLTGDGTVKTIVDRIIGDAVGTTATRTSNLTYHLIRSNAEKFAASGTYADNLKMYLDASESDLPSESYSGLTDFQVLVLDSTRSSTITALVNAYISVLTNCDQTGTGASAARYTSIKAQTYQWDSQKKRFTAVAEGSSSLVVNANKSLSVNGNKHDNQNDQFTLLDVYYSNPSNENEGYHLYIPVVVKRVIQVDFSVEMQTGSNTYTSAYAGSGAVLASYGENYTAQLTYSYTWTAAEWNNYISSGNSMLWNYDKQVQLGAEAGELKWNTTRFTLVDPNRYGSGNTYFIGTGSVLTSDGDSDAVLKFEDLTGYTSVPISDLLTLKVIEDNSGTLKVTGTAGKDDPVPGGSTLRIWNGTSFTYYGPKTSDDTGDVQGYSVKMADQNGDVYGDTQSVTVREIYYLTVDCTEGSGVNTRMMSLGEFKLTSTDSNALPTRTGSTGTKYYTLGDFYTISDTQIRTTSENGTQMVELMANDYIDVSVSATVNVSEAQKQIFQNYAYNVTSYFRFGIRLSDGSSSSPIDAAGITVTNLKIGTKELTSADYTAKLIGGVYYITITSQTGSAYANQTVSADIHFSYEEDAGRIAAQFPERTNADNQAGVNYAVDASIAYSQNSIDGSSMYQSEVNSTKYYREKIEVASIAYNAYNTASEDGNTSQLGINGREVGSADGQTITSLGMYNATQLSNLNLTDSSSALYPAKLVCTLTLEKKTDQSDGTVKYEQVNIGTYLSNITVVSAGNSVSGSVNTGGSYAFTVPLTAAQIANLSSEQIELDLSYFAKSDESLEAIGEVGQYANYRVTLTAHLANNSGTALVEDTSDYLIYTNAKFYLGIISTTDFGN